MNLKNIVLIKGRHRNKPLNINKFKNKYKSNYLYFFNNFIENYSSHSMYSGHTQCRYYGNKYFHSKYFFFHNPCKFLEKTTEKNFGWKCYTVLQ